MVSVRPFRIVRIMAVALPAAAIAVSCSGKLRNIDADKVSSAPTQVVENMFATQSDNGRLSMRMEADLMERFEKGPGMSYEDFPEGFKVFAYNEEGLLETRIVSDKARHTTEEDNEQWAAYGNVVIDNFIKGERIMTDTLYWDREREMIYTDCYVRLSSPQGFMQGYGMESDEMARNARLLRPFDSYGIVAEDSTGTAYRDTVNLIGPKL